MHFLFSPPFSRRVKMHFPFGNWLSRRVKMFFLFSPPFSRFHNNELRKHTLIIRWLHAKAQRFAKFIPHGNHSTLNPQLSTLNSHLNVPRSSELQNLRTSEQDALPQLSTFIVQPSTLIASLPFFNTFDIFLPPKVTKLMFFHRYLLTLPRKS